MRQALEAARLVSIDPAVHERIVRDIAGWIRDADLSMPPPLMAQRMHRELRALSKQADPYAEEKRRQNMMALELVDELRDLVRDAEDPLGMASRLAIAGNIIDLGVRAAVEIEDVRVSIEQALTEPLVGEPGRFSRAVGDARKILYLADNAGEIAFDRLLVEQLIPGHDVTLAVRGYPVINDATEIDAQTVGLNQLNIKIINNGSDAPGTLLPDCSPEFHEHFDWADLIISKGQGNAETLWGHPANIAYLFKAKCSVMAEKCRVKQGSSLLLCPNTRLVQPK